MKVKVQKIDGKAVSGALVSVGLGAHAANCATTANAQPNTRLVVETRLGAAPRVGTDPCGACGHAELLFVATAELNIIVCTSTGR